MIAIRRLTLLLCFGLPACACGLSGCAAVPPLDLPGQDGLAPDVEQLRHEGLASPMRLDLRAVALLVVQNNPDLRAVRAQAGVAQAQVLQAGILPNPALTGSFLPLLAGFGSTPAWNAGISQDIRSLITLHARRQAARAGAAQLDAQILWQEWQVVGHAWLLTVQLIEGERMHRLLEQARSLYAQRDAASEQAMLAGNATLSGVAPDRAALQAANAQLRELEQRLLQRRHELAALIGLVPDAALPLDAALSIPNEDSRTIEAMLPTLAQRRPDLVALRLGYRAQDARLRAAMLSRFPNLVFGLTGGSDNSNVRNIGPQVTMELPIFDRNQGNIAIEQATRRQLQAEYAARLAASVGQIRAMLSEQALLRRQIGTLRRELGQATREAAAAAHAFAAGDLDERSAIDLIATGSDRKVELVAIEQSVLEQQVAIASLLGLGLQPVAMP